VNAETVLARVNDNVSAGRVFGPPIEREGVTLVPVAWVVGGGGGGVGQAGAEGQTQPDGAGFGLAAIPIGAYVIKGGEARFVPSYDIGFLTLVGVGLVKTLFKRRRKAR
jgi:uncharacterized spore protein YtfJ